MTQIIARSLSRRAPARISAHLCGQQCPQQRRSYPHTA